MDAARPVPARVLERVPIDRPDWKPHEESMPLGYLANLVATMPSWIAMIVDTDEHLMKNWRLLAAGRPRHIVIRDAMFAHLAHHRGQLTVYLRFNEMPVLAIYGPSADEAI
jgi:hypothetical protein